MDSNFHDYSIKKKYCPAMRQNVIFKVENNAAHREFCMNKEYCSSDNKCMWNHKSEEKLNSETI